jgi:tRNA threonylcarbamoyladenosine biosynthesis protein TsaB
MLAAIETTGDTCGVALFEDDILRVELHASFSREHDRLLAWMFEQALEIARIRADEIESYAVSVGPGSYTGIRIGLSFAIGAALAYERPIVPVPTLDAIAYDVRDLGRVGHRSRVISMVPAGSAGLFAALYEIQPEFRRLTDIRTVALEQIPPLLDENVFAAGPGAALVDSSCFDCIAMNSEVLTARAVGRRGLALRRSGVGCRPEEVEPLYISGLPMRKV